MMRDDAPSLNADQRARDGRLAWIIVGCCAAVTITLAVVLAYSVSGSFTQMLSGDLQAGAAQPRSTVSMPTPAPTGGRPSYDVVVADPPAGGEQVRKRSGPVRETTPPPPRANGSELGEVRKQGATAENEAVKSRDHDDAPTASRRRDTPREPAEPEDPAQAARRI